MKTVKFMFLSLTLSSAILNSQADQQTMDARISAESRADSATSQARDVGQQGWDKVKEGTQEVWTDTKSAFSEGVLQGKLEMALALNEHLKALEIDTEVQGSKAVLQGQVSSDVERELAESIALGIAGIDIVDNRLVVNEQLRSAESYEDQSAVKGAKRDFSQFVDDVSITASIKTELLANGEIKGLKIDVDTLNSRVTLSGTVETEAQKQLAESIARKRQGVTEVVNNIRVNS